MPIRTRPYQWLRTAAVYLPGAQQQKKGTAAAPLLLLYLVNTYR